MTYHLQIKVHEPSLLEYYEDAIVHFNNNHTELYRDSGFDLFIDTPIYITRNNEKKCLQLKVDHNISCAVYKELNDGSYIPSGYYLYPRSSISKTPLRMSNSLGIIDSGYRGNLIAKFDVIPDIDYSLEQGGRLCQICTPDLSSFSSISLVDTLTKTTRGTGGFGSSGK